MKTRRFFLGLGTLVLAYVGNFSYHSYKYNHVKNDLREAQLELKRAEARTIGMAIDFVNEYGYDNSKEGYGFSTAIRYGDAQNYEKRQKEKVFTLLELLNIHKRKSLKVF